MGVHGGTRGLGLFKGDLESPESRNNFTFGTINSSSAYRGNYCIQAVGGGGASGFSKEYIEIDPSASYQMICYARTLKRGTQTNSLAGGHIGFSCVDASKRDINPATQGGWGNTYLTRPLNAGDSYAYIQSPNGWYSASIYYFQYFLVYPPTHPEFSTPHWYSRIGYGDYNIYYSSSIQAMPEGDYRVQIVTYKLLMKNYFNSPRKS